MKSINLNISIAKIEYENIFAILIALLLNDDYVK